MLVVRRNPSFLNRESSHVIFYDSSSVPEWQTRTRIKVSNSHVQQNSTNDHRPIPWSYLNNAGKQQNHCSCFAKKMFDETAHVYKASTHLKQTQMIIIQFLPRVIFMCINLFWHAPTEIPYRVALRSQMTISTLNTHGCSFGDK